MEFSLQNRPAGITLDRPLQATRAVEYGFLVNGMLVDTYKHFRIRKETGAISTTISLDREHTDHYLVYLHAVIIHFTAYIGVRMKSPLEIISVCTDPV